MSRFPALLPELEQIASRSALVWPPCRMQNLLPDFMDCLARLGTFQASMLACSLALPYHGQGPLARGMLAVYLEQKALTALNRALFQKLSPADYELVLSRVPPGDPADLLQVADQGYVWALDYLDWCQQTGNFQVLHGSWLCYFPGYLERERRIAQEQYLLIRPLYQAAREDPGLEARLQARTPALALPGENHTNRVIAAYRESWRLRQGVRLVASLQPFRAVTATPPLDPEAVFAYQRQGDAFTLGCGSLQFSPPP